MTRHPCVSCRCHRVRPRGSTIRRRVPSGGSSAPRRADPVRTVRIGVLAVTLVAALLCGAGCSQISQEASGAESGSGPSRPAARPILDTVAWGVVDGMLSVVVENTTDRTLRNAVRVITARGRGDGQVATSLESPDGCCSVVDLPPGEEFGFYLDIGDAATDVSRVEVAYRNVAWASSAQEPANPLSAHP